MRLLPRPARLIARSSFQEKALARAQREPTCPAAVRRLPGTSIRRRLDGGATSLRLQKYEQAYAYRRWAMRVALAARRRRGCRRWLSDAVVCRSTFSIAAAGGPPLLADGASCRWMSIFDAAARRFYRPYRLLALCPKYETPVAEGFQPRPLRRGVTVAFERRRRHEHSPPDGLAVAITVSVDCLKRRLKCTGAAPQRHIAELLRRRHCGPIILGRDFFLRQRTASPYSAYA